MKKMYILTNKKKEFQLIYIPCVKVHWSLKSNKVRTWFPKSTKLYITMVALISYAALNKALMDAVLTHNGTKLF